MRPEPGAAGLLLALACVGLALLPEEVAAALAFEREALLAGQWWRLWSGHLVHFGPQHALANAVTLWACAAFLGRQGGALLLPAALLLAAPLISLFLVLAAPGMQEYRGASALATMLAGAAAIVLYADPRWRRAVLACAGGFGLWTLAQALGAGATLAGLPAGVDVAWQAHLAGALCALPLGLRLAQKQDHHRIEYQTSRHES